MNLPSGHKRINNSVNQFSAQKVASRNIGVNLPFQSGTKKSNSKDSFTGGKMTNITSGSKNVKGAILFHNAPLKMEGELNISNISKTPSRGTSKPNQGMNSGLLKNLENRSFTPNKSTNNSSSKGFSSSQMRPNTGNPFNKVKKLDLNFMNTQKTNIKKVKSYIIPKSARDTLNLSNHSGVNKSRLNDTNNSFIISDLMNKSKFSSLNRTGFSSTNARSATPNSKTSKISSKINDSKFTKSGADLTKFGPKKITPNVSKSPNNNISRLSNKITNVTKMPIKSHSPVMRSPIQNAKNKNNFDVTLLKQLQDFKNNKSPTPNILKKVNNTNNTKLLNIPNKFGAPLNVKRIVTGNLVNMNMNINNNNSPHDVSTNSTTNTKDISQYSNGTNNSNVGLSLNILKKESKEITRNDHNKNNSELINNSGNIISNNSVTANVRINNLAKEKDSKGHVDFREMNTSPLLKKKPETFFDVSSKDVLDLNDPFLNKMTNNAIMNKINLNNKDNSAIVKNSSMPIANKVTRKHIKLIHEYSKVGFSGYGVKKVNQDNYFVFKNFVGNPNHYYMAVCDGHGVLGHEVSGYLRENLPVNLSNLLKYKNKNILTHNVNSIIEDVFLDLNVKLHSNEIIDTTFSGSTCVSLIYTPEKILTANVGDSRAVIGRFVNGEWISHDLTRDHKPNEKDESARIKKRGGRIEPFRDEDGEFIGPHRVWLKEDDIPGLAMSRSFGDKVASSVGVNAEPEIFEYKFQEEDKFFIIASDGVWEFIESPECINIIKDYYLKNDILGCCEYIYKESCNRWMKEEEVIDDTTMIIVFLE